MRTTIKQTNVPYYAACPHQSGCYVAIGGDMDFKHKTNQFIFLLSILFVIAVSIMPAVIYIYDNYNY